MYLQLRFLYAVFFRPAAFLVISSIALLSALISESLAALAALALARAFYSDKEILVLDEFTSSLDKATEDKIINTILELNKSKTIVIVSHNNTMEKIANKIFKMEKGNLVKIK